MITEWTAFFGALASALAPPFGVLGIGMLIWDRRHHRRFTLAACSSCTEKLKALEPPKPTALIVMMVLCYAFGARFAAQPDGAQQIAETPSPDLGPTLEAAACTKENCENKTGCRCVSDQCRCNSENELAPPPAQPQKKKHEKPKKPISSIAQVLPKMAGELQPPWFANIPPSTAPLSPSL